MTLIRMSLETLNMALRFVFLLSVLFCYNFAMYYYLVSRPTFLFVYLKASYCHVTFGNLYVGNELTVLMFAAFAV